MVHRGPDDAGTATIGPATLGMRRLAIFDPANGRQPMQSPDGRLTLIFNGAIYNHRQLRAELHRGGWNFRTDCDTEVLLAAFHRWGEGCVARLRGMFAFAVWDRDQESLFLARDPFGIKPLYLHHTRQHLAFASELNALLASGLTPGDLDPISVADYLAWFSVPAPRTIYRNVVSLRPGEAATLTHGRLSLRTIWSFSGIPSTVPVSRDAASFQHELRARLEDTVSAHLLADVPVGAFLSGGVDSAAIVGLMRHLSGTAPRTFSITFDEAEFSEESAATETARHFGTQHVNHRLTGATVARDLDAIVAAMDQPTGDGINTYYAAQAARAGGVTVALSGLGGDELFGGYPSFLTTPRAGIWLPRWQWLPISVRLAFVTALRQGSTRERKLADILHYARDVTEAAALQRRVFSTTSQRSLLGPEARREIGQRVPFHPALLELATDLRGSSPLDIVSAWETRTYMTDLLLRDSDVMSMRHSLELRVPFVDRPLIEWLWRQPPEFKYGVPGEKTALRQAVADLLPPSLLTRPKRGFSLPFPVWMRRELRPFLDDAFSSACAGHTGIFDVAQIQSLWTRFSQRHDGHEWSRVWSLAMLLQFARQHRPVPAAPTRPSVTLTPQRLPRPSRKDSGGTRVLPRRLGLMAPEIFASEGGIPRILQTYLRALAEIAGRENGQVRLVALNDSVVTDRELPPEVSAALAEVRVSGRSKPGFIRDTLAISRGVDHLICGHVAQLPVAWLAARLNPGLRYSLVAHGIEVWRPFSLFERQALLGAHRVFCVSDYTRRELLTHCALPPGRAVVLPNALDPAFTIARGQPLATCQPVILSVGRLNYTDRYKGFQNLIEAMPAVRAEIPDAVLRIVGRGDDLPRLIKIRDALGMTQAVEFLGYVPDERLKEEFRTCRLFALPSRKEGFGLVYVEAMAHSRPCLAARAGGATEVISPESGVLVEHGDVPAIAQAAIQALRHPWDENALLNRAREFSYETFRGRLETLLA